ncbi:hypothetical protein L7F22_057875 [Adiantum nelumboides]|nr:hypothetical protein [Adiantum nelumboides]
MRENLLRIKRQRREHNSKWELAMQEEIKALHANDTWDLVELPKGRKAIPNKWVYKIKTVDAKPKYKARLVAKGYAQTKGIDFQEVFSPVVKMTTLRVLFAIVAALDFELDQMDVHTAFLHDDVEEELYLKQPRVMLFLERNICPIILVLYVDDMLIAAKKRSTVDALKEQLKSAFSMKDLGAAEHAYVGVAEDLNAVVVAFRGTQENSIQNWMEDLYFRQLDLNYPGCTGAMVHRGFFTAYHNTTLRPRVISAVMGILQDMDGLNVYVTGHSMGGAMAAFCSLDLVANYGLRNVRTVTFGQPRIGNSIFAEYFIKMVPQTYRMTHAHDMVPHLPPYYSLFPQRSYHHFGREVWIHKVDLRSLNYEVETVCDDTGEDPTCSRSVAGNSISDHLCYMGIFLQADTWSSCSFILRNNENLAVTTADGFVIKLPLFLKRPVEVQDPTSSLQLS